MNTEALTLELLRFVAAQYWVTTPEGAVEVVKLLRKELFPEPIRCELVPF